MDGKSSAQAAAGNNGDTAAPKVIMVPQVKKTSGGNNAYHNFQNDFVHITDPNERRRLALAEIDKAPFGWYHIRAIIVAGIGFFTDSYDIFAINLVTSMFGKFNSTFHLRPKLTGI